MGKRGFTLIEMVMVMLIVAILSVFVAQKASLFNEWTSASEASQLPSFFQASQSIAMASRRPVYIVVSSNLLSACYDSLCSSPVVRGGGALVLPLTAGKSGTLSSFNFDSNGVPSFATVKTITVGGRTVTVEPYTGLIW